MTDVNLFHGISPIVYHYIDLSIPVPLQTFELWLIRSAARLTISTAMFWRLLLGIVCTLAFGSCGENKITDPTVGFILGMCGRGYILYGIFAGEASSVAGQELGKNKTSSFEIIRFIVNLAVVVNKTALCLTIWASIQQDTRERGLH